MEFIDFHTHIYPDKIAKRATEFLCNFFNNGAEWPGTSENLLIFGKAAGISKFVILPVASKIEQVRKINDFAISENNEHEEYYCFGSIHAGMENPCAEIDYIRKSGLYGIKIHPENQQFAIDDKRLFEAYDYLSQTGLPILFHCGDPVSDLSHPARLRKVIDEFPKMRIVAAHFGGWQKFDEARELLKSDDCFFDLSSSLPFLGEKKMVEFINHFGEDKIFFGTDFPLCDQSKEVENFLKLPISDEAKEKIASKNAIRFLEGK